MSKRPIDGDSGANKRAKCSKSINCVLLDIEGTTTSISFVVDVLFPYIEANVHSFVREHFDSLTAEFNLLQNQAELDVAAGLDGAAALPQQLTNSPAHVDLIAANVKWQMARNAKTTALKQLQGKMWLRGYESGQFVGHLYDDVLPFLRRMRAQHVPVFIYSSGSVAAQRLLFGHSVHGDLLGLFAGHFDTKNLGNKLLPASYETLASILGPNVLFVTDNLLEARAARQADMETLLSVRPGTMTLPADVEFATVTSFEQIDCVTGRQ